MSSFDEVFNDYNPAFLLALYDVKRFPLNVLPLQETVYILHVSLATGNPNRQRTLECITQHF